MTKPQRKHAKGATAQRRAQRRWTNIGNAILGVGIALLGFAVMLGEVNFADVVIIRQSPIFGGILLSFGLVYAAAVIIPAVRERNRRSSAMS